MVNLCASFGWAFVTGYNIRNFHPFVTNKNDPIPADCFIFRKSTGRTFVASVLSEQLVDAATAAEAVRAPAAKQTLTGGRKVRRGPAQPLVLMTHRSPP